MNIQEQETEDVTSGETTIKYVYDEYRHITKYSEGIIERILNSWDAWVTMILKEDYDNTAAEVRALRNKLLEESDPYMTIDRLSLDSGGGSTFMSWLKFLQSFVSALAGSWATYRQKLRDIPEQPGFPYNVEFPKKPD